MPDHDTPAASPVPDATSGEFDFATPPAENPRVRRRSLKGPSTMPINGQLTGARVDGEIESTEPVKTASASSVRPAFASTAKPSVSATGGTSRPTPTSNHTASPHGTRPATLYYSNGPRTDKPAPSPTPMKSTPTATPAAAAPAPTSSTRPTAPASSLRPTSVIDYRANVERQAREQRSVGNVLAYVVYTLTALFVVGALLAGFGVYSLSKQIRQQSMTVSELDSHYAAANLDLSAKLASNLDTLTQAQAQIARQQDLIVKEQETINKLMASSQENATAVRQERQARAEETASLRSRLKNLEYRGPSTQKY